MHILFKFDTNINFKFILLKIFVIHKKKIKNLLSKTIQLNRTFSNFIIIQ